MFDLILLIQIRYPMLEFLEKRGRGKKTRLKYVGIFFNHYKSTKSIQ